MDRRLFLSGMLGIAGAAAIAGMARPAKRWRASQKPEAAFLISWMRQLQTLLSRKLKHRRNRHSIQAAGITDGIGGAFGEGSAAAIGTVVGTAGAAIAGVFGSR